MLTSDYRADLHCHTIYSDSSVTPECVVELAKSAGLSAVAITDHDTYDGISEAVAAGKKAGITVIPGIELSAYDYDRHRRAHILAYGVRRPEKLRSVYEYTTKEREKTGAIMLERAVRRFGVPEEMILRHKRGRVLYKQHIMHGLMDAGLADSIFGETYRELFGKGSKSISESIEYLDVHKVLEFVQKAGGIPVLAHPAEYHSEELMEELIAHREIMGIEAFHETASKEQAEIFARLARENGLLVTGGTDFHGMYHKTPIPIGSFTAPDVQDFSKYFMISVDKTKKAVENS